MTVDVSLHFIVVLVLASYGHCWSYPSLCDGCVPYTLVNKLQDYEERLYSVSRWVTIDVASTSERELSNGFGKLYRYISGDNKDGRPLPSSRPGLISVEGVDGLGEYTVSISYFVPDEIDLPEPNDEFITVTTLPSGKVYVRTFDRSVDISGAEENYVLLRTALEEAGKSFDSSAYQAAVYDRHSEVWISAA